MSMGGGTEQADEDERESEGFKIFLFGGTLCWPAGCQFFHRRNQREKRTQLSFFYLIILLFLSPFG
jgi:hypothetical protein